MNTIQELKAKAYDMIAAIEQGQMMLKQINAQIAEALKAEADKAENKPEE